MTGDATPLSSASTAEDSYGSFRAWYALVILELQVLLVGVDIAIVTLLVHPIETALRLDDVGFATFTATPFFVGIAVAYYPSGLLADTFRRRDIIAAGAVVWALAALVAARADSGAMLFVARLLAGLGTGVSGPSVFSMLCDAFPRSRRAFAQSAFVAGLSIGGGIGLTICGALVQATQRSGTLHVGGMLLAPWQQCFVAVAACGVATVALVLTVSEPPRRERAVRRDANLGLTLGVFIRYLRRNALLWGAILLGYSIGGTSYYANVVWAPTFGARRFGAAELSSIALLGTLGAAGSLLGAFGGGLLAQRVINVGKSRLLPQLFIIFSAMMGVFAATFPLMPSWTLAVVGIGLLGAASTALLCLVPIGIQETAPNEVRGQLVGLLGLIGFIPSVLGPTLVAFLASHTFAKTGGLAPAMAWVGGITSVIAVLLFAVCGAPYERAMRELRAIAADSQAA